VKNLFRLSAAFIALTLVFFSCEQDADLSSPNTVADAAYTITLPSGKLATVAEAGYIVFDHPTDFLDEVKYISENQELTQWEARFTSMLSVGNKLATQSTLFTDEESVIATLSEEQRALYVNTNEMIRPAQTFIGYRALLNDRGLVQVGEDLHLLTDAVQMTAKPGMEAELINHYLAEATTGTKDIEVILQNNEQQILIDESKVNAKPMNCPSGGVAHRQYIDREQVVGEVFSLGNRFRSGLTYFYTLSWYVNGYNYTVNRRGNRAQRANRDIEIVNNNLAVQGGLFQGTVAQAAFQFSDVDNGTSQLNNTNYIQRVVAQQTFSTTSDLSMRTNYVGGESYIMRQGNSNPITRLGVLIFCD